MNRFTTIMIVFGLLMGLLSPTAVAIAQEIENDPEFVIRGIVESVNDGAIDEALAMVADDAVAIITPPMDSEGLYIGKEAVRQHFEANSEVNETIFFTDFDVVGSTANWRALLWNDSFAEMDIAPVVMEGAGVVKEGMLQTFVWTMSDESMARYADALKEEANLALVKEHWELWAAGDAEALDAYYSADFFNHSPPLPPDREGVIQVAVNQSIAFPDAKWTMGPMVANDDMVAFHATFTGTHSNEYLGAEATGEDVEFTLTAMFRIEDGKIAERWGDAAMLDLLTPLGFALVPPDAAN